MSINTIERILWEFGEDEKKARAFLNDPDGYLAKFPLTDNERKMVRTMDVAALEEYGLTHMLGLMSWSALYGNNPLTMLDYLKRMNRGNLPNNMQMPAPVFGIMMFAVAVRKALLRVANLFGLKKNIQ